MPVVLFDEQEKHQGEDAAHCQASENEQEAVEGEGNADHNRPDKASDRKQNDDSTHGNEREGGSGHGHGSGFQGLQVCRCPFGTGYSSSTLIRSPGTKKGRDAGAATRNPASEEALSRVGKPSHPRAGSRRNPCG